jgi:hypothetical protein
MQMQQGNTNPQICTVLANSNISIMIEPSLCLNMTPVLVFHENRDININTKKQKLSSVDEKKSLSQHLIITKLQLHLLN